MMKLLDSRPHVARQYCEAAMVTRGAMATSVRAAVSKCIRFAASAAMFTGLAERKAEHHEQSDVIKWKSNLYGE
jgi:hypothetical protein